MIGERCSACPTPLVILGSVRGFLLQRFARRADLCQPALRPLPLLRQLVPRRPTPYPWSSYASSFSAACSSAFTFVLSSFSFSSMRS